MLVNLLELCTISKNTDLKFIKRVIVWPKTNWMSKLWDNKNEKDLSCFQIGVLLCTSCDTSNSMIDLTSNISWNSLSIKKQITVLHKFKRFIKIKARTNRCENLIPEFYENQFFRCCHKYTNSIWKIHDLNSDFFKSP